ncbi:MAG TPA: C2 family cysteine protease, partial [Gemmataceae bacterium]|nr:C2 family cysteine protease [Gemmataceae bacterium]
EGGRRTDFQNGYIVWTKANGAKEFSSNTEPLDLLKDKDVRDLAGTLFRRDHALDRSDVLEIFRQVEKDGRVSDEELQDLKTLVAFGRILAMPDYVRLLASKVVFGDPANGHYLGAELGSLEADSEAAKLESLVKKWFLGMDHPATGKSGVSYQLVEGSLFGKGVNYRDVEQGTTGDCYYLASLAEIALRNPNVIRQMFVDNGDDTYTVLFQHDGGFDCVTVDRYLPIDAKRHFLFADVKHDPKDPNLKLWVPLAEKAYAQLAESGWLHAKAENSYTAVGSSGNPGWATQVVSGGNAMIRQSLDFDAVVRAYQAGNELTFTSKPTKADTEKNKVVVKHCYAVMSVDIKERTVTLFNPWGVQSRPEFPGELTLSWSQIQESFVNWNNVTR